MYIYVYIRKYMYTHTLSLSLSLSLVPAALRLLGVIELRQHCEKAPPGHSFTSRYKPGRKKNMKLIVSRHFEEGGRQRDRKPFENQEREHHHIDLECQGHRKKACRQHREPTSPSAAPQGKSLEKEKQRKIQKRTET